MKKLFVVLAALAAASPALAQQQPTAARGTFGIGVAIVPDRFPIEIYFPIQVAPAFRLEPSFGVRTADTDAGDQSDVTLGLGAFVQQRAAGPFDVYFGGRIKLNFASEDTGLDDNSGTDVQLAAALGGEYYLASRFSMGVEGNLGYYSDSDVNGDDSGFFTNGLAFLRLYF
jgi:hypothetical protein